MLAFVRGFFCGCRIGPNHRVPVVPSPGFLSSDLTDSENSTQFHHYYRHRTGVGGGGGAVCHGSCFVWQRTRSPADDWPCPRPGCPPTGSCPPPSKGKGRGFGSMDMEVLAITPHPPPRPLAQGPRAPRRPSCTTRATRGRSPRRATTPPRLPPMLAAKSPHSLCLPSWHRASFAYNLRFQLG